MIHIICAGGVVAQSAAGSGLVVTFGTTHRNRLFPWLRHLLRSWLLPLTDICGAYFALVYFTIGNQM